jgi:hypothetical protein
MSGFTWPEHVTHMTLWCIARSPLMWGGDPLTSSEKSISFLKNEEVLAVNQNSENNRQVFRQNNKVAWMADIPGSDDKYLALFNIGENNDEVTFTFEYDYLRGQYAVRDLWAKKELGDFEKEFSVELEPHGAGLYSLTKK